MIWHPTPSSSPLSRSHCSPLAPLSLLFLLAEIVFVEQDVPLQRQHGLLCLLGGEGLSVLRQYHGAEQGRVEDVAHRWLGERHKVCELLLDVFGNQPPVVVHHLVHLLHLAHLFSCQAPAELDMFLTEMANIKRLCL